MEEGASLFPEGKCLDDIPLVEDDIDELEDPEFGVEPLPAEAESNADSQGRGCSKKKRGAAAWPKGKSSAWGRVQALRLRKGLSALDELREEKGRLIRRTAAELHACRQRMDRIAQQQESVAAETAAESEADNIAAVGRLQAVSRRLCAELQNERDLQAKIMATLKDNQSAMWHMEIQEGQLEDVRRTVQEQAEAARRSLQMRADEQLRREKEAYRKAERNRLLRIRKSMYLQKEHGLRHQKLVEDARKNHRVAVKFLKASLGRVQEQARQQETESREHMRRRMDAVLALKNSITANRETLRKFQAWGQAKAELAEQKAQAEKEAILAQGGDAFKHLFHQRRRQELEAEKHAFEEEQKLRRNEIVSRILKEEAEEDRRRRPHPPAPAAARPTLRDRTWGYLATVCEGKPATAASCYLVVEKETFGYPENPLETCASSESVQGDPGAVGGDDDVLAEPEIPGLWDEGCKSCQVATEDGDRKPVGGTKMDKDLLARTIQRLRSGVIHKQVASGREFKGRPFNSKPEVVHFKDFDVGKVYKKKVTLINATYTINYCKLEGVEEHLRDFISVE